jgi:methionine synthase II (cobalamin-independent)
MFGDLERFLAAVPHDDVEVQWDVASEFGLLEGEDWYKLGEFCDPDAVLPSLVRCIDVVPEDVRVGLHLCYGDYQHGHESEPESIGVQVKLVNDLAAAAHRRIDFAAFTVPQDRDDEAFFEPLKELRPDSLGRSYFGIVPYYPDRQPEGAVARMASYIDQYIDDWGVCTECGMGRHEAETVPALLDLHRSIVETVAV